MTEPAPTNRPFFLALWDHEHPPAFYQVTHRPDLEPSSYLVRAERLAQAAQALVESDDVALFCPETVTLLLADLAQRLEEFRQAPPESLG